MIRRPPRSTLSSSSAASDVYKRQVPALGRDRPRGRRACARRQRLDGALLSWRHAGLRRLRAGAADPQRAAHGVPARPCADGDACLRQLHGRAGIRVDPSFGVPGRGLSRPGRWLVPGLAVAGVGALMMTRDGGISRPPYASMNLGGAAGDLPDSVAANRARFAEACSAAPVYLGQVHGARVVHVAAADARAGAATHEADASVTTEPGVACTVLVADCLPVLFAAPGGRAVGAAHAGWRE